MKILLRTLLKALTKIKKATLSIEGAAFLCKFLECIRIAV